MAEDCASGRRRRVLQSLVAQTRGVQYDMAVQPVSAVPPPPNSSVHRHQVKPVAVAAEGAAVVVVVVSGKRKVGKDFVCERLLEQLGPATAEIGRLSAPLKKAYALEHGLDYEELLTDGPYKEKYRRDMIAWGEQRREKDPGFFARLVMRDVTKPVIIISDARRPSDVEFFQQGAVAHYWKLLTVRIEALETVRAQRGWAFTAGVDDAESECGLDGREWDVVLDNGVELQKLDEQLSDMQSRISSHLSE